ncbi:transporter family-2 protein [Orenia metallireducens]|jgi:transporter family-2 protein|uniref:Transporter family-2 protein n=1 Tax=Orenia metallireducens TaxID=1413210 RepID=A0A285HFZ3_9FIRM|nr:DMT family transporter [Orenia metallireducens]PRX27738.1 transporter family-2 protein [Orenia metallireducens]SNY33746.1 transporter family-2 protein [Orenia metallireducens]
MEGIIFIIVAAVSGLAMAIQGSLNSVLGKVVGQLEATFVVHIIATVLVALLLFALSLGKGDWSQLAEAPWYTYLGGLLNVIILYGVIYSIPHLGVANATTAIVAGQVLTAVLVDHFGLFGLEKIEFHWIQLVGLLLLAVGVKLLYVK